MTTASTEPHPVGQVDVNVLTPCPEHDLVDQIDAVGQHADARQHHAVFEHPHRPSRRVPDGEVEQRHQGDALQRVAERLPELGVAVDEVDRSRRGAAADTAASRALACARRRGGRRQACRVAPQRQQAPEEDRVEAGVRRVVRADLDELGPGDEPDAPRQGDDAEDANSADQQAAGVGEPHHDEHQRPGRRCRSAPRRRVTRGSRCRPGSSPSSKKIV